MDQSDSTPDIKCTMDRDEELAERSERIKSNLVPHYQGYEEADGELSIRFAGTDEAVTAVARFITNELLCCSFAEYEFSVSPPYDHTVLTMSGPDGTREMFRKEFISRLEEWSG